MKKYDTNFSFFDEDDIGCESKKKANKKLDEDDLNQLIREKRYVTFIQTFVDIKPKMKKIDFWDTLSKAIKKNEKSWKEPSIGLDKFVKHSDYYFNLCVYYLKAKVDDEYIYFKQVENNNSSFTYNISGFFNKYFEVQFDVTDECIFESDLIDFIKFKADHDEKWLKEFFNIHSEQIDDNPNNAFRCIDKDILERVYKESGIKISDKYSLWDRPARKLNLIYRKRIDIYGMNPDKFIKKVYDSLQTGGRIICFFFGTETNTKIENTYYSGYSAYPSFAIDRFRTYASVSAAFALSQSLNYQNEQPDRFKMCKFFHSYLAQYNDILNEHKKGKLKATFDNETGKYDAVDYANYAFHQLNSNDEGTVKFALDAFNETQHIG